ncbi:MAG TPA: hypothetical protein VGJ55_09070 [Pyrinomonadaceae bacterium]
MNRSRRAASSVLGALALVLFCLVEANTQQDLSRPKAEVKLGGGMSTFGGVVNDNYRHTVVAGSVRIYLYRRLSIEPEVMYMQRGDFDRDWVFTPHVAVDLLDSRGRIVPYAIAGVGVEHHRDQFTFDDFFNGNALVTRKVSVNVISANAGVGVKLFLTDRLFVAPDIRVGHEPSFRATVSVGYVFSGRKH